MRGKPEDQALITGKWFLPLRGDNTSKADFGCLLAVCGSAGMSGAACMAVSSALRCGAGLVALASVERVIERAAQSLWEPIFLPLADDGKGFIAQEAAGLLRGYRRATALLLGCGMGKRPETAALAVFRPETPAFAAKKRQKKGRRAYLPPPQPISSMSGLSW